MARFVCYFLRVVVDGVAQEEGDQDSDWSSVYPSSTVHSLRSGRPCRLGRTEDAAIRNSSSSPQRRNKVDNMKDAHKLFSWQGSQRLQAMQLWDALDGNNEDAQMQVLLDALTSFFVSFGISLSSTRSVKSAHGDEHTKDLPCRANSSFDPRGCKIEDP